MRDHSHSLPEAAGAPTPMHGYGDRRVSGGGLAVTVALHLLLLAAFLLRPDPVKQPAPAGGAAVTYIAPVAPKPQPRPERAPPRKRAPVPERVEIARLPDTITLPKELPLAPEPPAPEPPAPQPPKPDLAEPVPDMADMIAQRQRARARQQLQQRGEQSEAVVSERPGANAGPGGNGEASMDILSMTFSSAELRYVDSFPGRPDRIVNLKVRLGGEPDIETAIIQTMVEVMQATMKPDFEYKWGNTKPVMLSARREDTAALFAHLMRRHFPKYRAPRP